MKFCKILIFQQSRAEFFSSGDSLFILPFADKFRISTQQHLRYLPSVEFRRPCVDRRRKKTILETVAQSGGLVSDSSRNEPDDGVRQDCCREFTSAEYVVSA